MSSFVEIIGLLLFALLSVVLSDKNRKARGAVQQRLNGPARHPNRVPADPTAEDIRYWALNEPEDEDEQDLANDGIDQQSEVFEAPRPAPAPQRVEARTVPVQNPFSSGPKAIGQSMLEAMQSAALMGDDRTTAQPALPSLPPALSLQALKAPELQSINDLVTDSKLVSDKAKAGASSTDRTKTPPARGKQFLTPKHLRQAIIAQTLLGPPRAQTPWLFNAQGDAGEASS